MLTRDERVLRGMCDEFVKIAANTAFTGSSKNVMKTMLPPTSSIKTPSVMKPASGNSYSRVNPMGANTTVAHPGVDSSAGSHAVPPPPV